MALLILLSLLAAVLLLFVFPFVFGEVMVSGLTKLHLDPSSATAAVIGIVLGGFINIPVKRYPRDEDVVNYPYDLLGFADQWPGQAQTSRETVLAVNVGGCLIPTGLAIYQLTFIVQQGAAMVGALLLACAVNILVCYLLARPTPGVGIVMPGLVPPLVATIMAWLLAPDQAPPVAFVAGVTGPLVGADLLHLKDVRHIAAGMASIGGAGTFDGIVLSGIVAAYLA